MERYRCDVYAWPNQSAASIRAGGFAHGACRMELPEWNKIHERDRLAGCSLTGVQDAIGNWDIGLQDDLLALLKETAQKELDDYAGWLRIIARPLLITTVQTLPLVAGWTSEFTRVTDDGILFIDEIEPDIDDNEGFTYKATYPSVNENMITATYKNEIKRYFKNYFEKRTNFARYPATSLKHKEPVGFCSKLKNRANTGL